MNNPWLQKVTLVAGKRGRRLSVTGREAVCQQEDGGPRVAQATPPQLELPGADPPRQTLFHQNPPQRANGKVLV